MRRLIAGNMFRDNDHAIAGDLEVERRLETYDTGSVPEGKAFRNYLIAKNWKGTV